VCRLGARVQASSVLLSLAELNDASNAVDAARQKLQQVDGELSAVKPIAAKLVSVCFLLVTLLMFWHCACVRKHMSKDLLMKFLILSVLFYGASNTNLKSLTHSWHAVFWKLFGTNDVDCINDIHRFMGYLPVVTEIDARRVGFLYRTMSCNNTVMNFLYDVFGRYELQALLAKYDITGICSPRRFRFLVRN